MNIITSSGDYSLSLGGSDTWKTLCSTIRFHLSASGEELAHVFSFLKSGRCANRDCLAAAREFNLVRDALSQFGPEKIVYDEKNPDQAPPWGNDISPVITSCANYLTTGDGNDLLAEIVKLFVCAAYTKTDVELM